MNEKIFLYYEDIGKLCKDFTKKQHELKRNQTAYFYLNGKLEVVLYGLK